MFKDKIKKGKNFLFGTKNESGKDSKEDDPSSIDFDKIDNNIYYSVDEEGNIKDVSPRVNSYGFSPNKLISTNFLDLIFPPDKERLREEFEHTINTGEEHTTRFRIKNKKGELFWFEENSELDYDKFGNIIGLEGFLHDISDYKKAEKEMGKFCLSLGELVNKRTSKLVKTNLELQRVNYKLKEMSDKLQESEKEKVTILDNIKELITYQNMDHQILWLNKAAAESVDSDKDKLKGKHCYKIWGENKGPCEKCPVEKTFETGEIEDEKVETKDGRQWFIKSAPVKNEDGEMEGTVEIALNITDLEGAKNELHKKERKYRELFNNSPVSLWLEDFSGVKESLDELKEKGVEDIETYFDNHPEELSSCVSKVKVLNVNKKSLDLYNAKCKEDLLQNLDKVFDEDSYQGFKKQLFAIVKGKEECEVKTTNRKLTGEKIDINLKWNVIDGDLSKVFVSIEDITEKEKAKQKFLESESKFRTIAEKGLVGVYLFRKDKYIYVNPALAQIFGYTVEEMLEEKTPIDVIYPEDRGIVKENIGKRINGDIDSIHYTFRGMRKDEKIIICEALGRRIEYKGEPAVMGTLLDITEREKSKEKLKDLNYQLKEANKRLKEISLIDPLTEVYNHRYLNDAIESEFHRAQRYDYPFSIIMLDIDYFKSINDAYGHQVGDLILKQFASHLKNETRQYDTVVRFGGEEFVILSPRMNRNMARNLARRLLNSIHLHDFGNENFTVKLKVSFGVSSWPEDEVFDGMSLVDIADKALNKSKEVGGDRIFSTEDMRKGDFSGVPEEGDTKFLKEKITKLKKRSNQSLIESIFAFAKTIEVKDHYTGSHVESTVTYAKEIARALGLNREEVGHIREAAVLHDLGKIGIPERILNKESQLSEEEYEKIKKHPKIGVDIIRPIHSLHELIPIILYHHERFDGEGYPQGLKGKEIPIGARIVAVADVYQALASNRPYRKAYPKEKAVEIIKKGANTQFDPAIVDLFLEVIK